MAEVNILDTVPQRVLAIYAHPDDPYVASGGTLARWAREGADVQAVVCTNGDKGTSAVGDPSSLSDEGSRVDVGALGPKRVKEALRAGEVLGIGEQHFLGFSDGELDEATLRAEIVVWVRRVMPDVVVSHDPTAVFFGRDYFNHRDHRVVGWAALDAVSPAAALPLYFPKAGSPWQVRTVYLSGTMEPDAWVDISTTLAAKVEALSCHASQFQDAGEWFRSAVHERAEEAGRQAGLVAAESFRTLRLIA